MKYIDADKLKDEIQANLAAISFNDDYQEGYEACGMSVLKSIDALQSEQPEMDLEKEIDVCWQNWLSPSNQKEVEGVLPKTEFAMYARHFAQWGAEHLRDSTKMIGKSLEEAAKEYCKTIFHKPFSENPQEEHIVYDPDKYDGFIAGAKWGAEHLKK